MNKKYTLAKIFTKAAQPQEFARNIHNFVLEANPEQLIPGLYLPWELDKNNLTIAKKIDKWLLDNGVSEYDFILIEL